MTRREVDQAKTIRERIAEEETIRERVDKDGNRWTKVYFGGGAHFRNWLSQFVELKGEENVKVEEADSTGFQCYEEGGEKMYRIYGLRIPIWKTRQASSVMNRMMPPPFYDSIEAYQDRR